MSFVFLLYFLTFGKIQYYLLPAILLVQSLKDKSIPDSYAFQVWWYFKKYFSDEAKILDYIIKIVFCT